VARARRPRRTRARPPAARRQRRHRPDRQRPAGAARPASAAASAPGATRGRAMPARHPAHLCRAGCRRRRRAAAASPEPARQPQARGRRRRRLPRRTRCRACAASRALRMGCLRRPPRPRPQPQRWDRGRGRTAPPPLRARGTLPLGRNAETRRRMPHRQPPRRRPLRGAGRASHAGSACAARPCPERRGCRAGARGSARTLWDLLQGLAPAPPRLRAAALRAGRAARAAARRSAPAPPWAPRARQARPHTRPAAPSQHMYCEHTGCGNEMLTGMLRKRAADIMFTFHAGCIFHRISAVCTRPVSQGVW